MPLTYDSRVVQADNLLSAEVMGEAVLMNIQTGNYFGLDMIGTEILQHLSEPVMVADLCRTLEAEFDADRETIRADVLHLFEQMLEHGLIKVLG